MPLTNNMKLDLPVVGTTTGPEYATLLVEALESIDSHDHTNRKGKKVPTAGLDIDDNLEFNGNLADEVQAVRFENATSALSTTDFTNTVYPLNGELVYVDGNGNQIQITSSGALNVSGVSGNISGLAGTSAAVTYNDTAKTFFFTQSSGVAAHIQGGILRMQEDSGSNTVSIRAPSVDSNYELDFPSSAPASNNSYLRIATDGTMEFGTISVTGLNYISLDQGTGVFTVSQIDPTSDIDTTGAVTGQQLTYSGSGVTYNNPHKVEGSSSSPTAISAAGTISISSDNRNITNYVAGSGGAVTIGGIDAGKWDGQELTLVGTSDTNTVSIDYSAGSLELNGNVTLQANETITLKYDTQATAWVELTRSS